jgi:hypothetical protein
MSASVYAGLVAIVVALSSCSNKPESVNDFAQLDSAGKPIQCGDLIAANTAALSQIAPSMDEHFRPVVMTAAENGYAFKQCQSEIEADRHKHCDEYAQRLHQSLVGDPRQALGPSLQYDHLPSDWTGICAAEIRSAVAGVNNGFAVDLRQPNPIVSLAQGSVALPLDSVTKLSMDSRDANVSVWRVVIATGSETRSLWFSNEAKATAAYDQLRSAWTHVRPAMLSKDNP